MRLTVIKGILPDRVVVGFWIGETMQSITMSYTELGDIMSRENIEQIMETPIGIWRASCDIRLAR